MPPIKRRTFLKGTGAAAAVATLPSVLQNNPSAQSKPNVAVSYTHLTLPTKA